MKPERQREPGDSRYGRNRWARLLAVAVVLGLVTGCAAIKRNVPHRDDVPLAAPLPIDGIWILKENGKRHRIEGSRIWIMEQLVVGPVYMSEGDVVTLGLTQTGPHTFKGRDLGIPGPWQAELTDAGLEIVVRGALGPSHFTMTPVELDHPAWYEAQLASETLVPPPRGLASALPSGSTAQSAGLAPALPADVIGDLSSFGRYYALVIGNNGYRGLPPLETAINDAESVATVLEQRYGFDVTLLKDASRAQILTRLRNLRETLTDQDNLLIYYAGHGWLDKEADEGYWLPIDAEEDSDVNWISNATITGYLRSIRAKHVMIVADSCYSGTLTRGIKLEVRSPDYLDRMARMRARIVLSSGGLEPVTDAGGGGHSAFANSFLAELESNPSVIDSTTLYSRIRRPVMLAADQAPELADIRKAGHEGGDFLFIRTDGTP